MRNNASYRTAFLCALLFWGANCATMKTYAPVTEEASAQELNNYANLLQQEGDLEEALHYYEEALWRYRPGEYKDKAVCYYNFGYALRRLERFQEAIAAYRLSKALNPEFEWTYTNLGLVYSLTGRDQDALKVYQQGLKRFENSLYLIENTAILYVQMKQPELAKPFAQRSLEIRRSRPKLENNERWIKEWTELLGR